MSLSNTRLRSALRRMSAGSVIGALLLGVLLGCGSDPANDVVAGQADASGGSVESDGTAMPPWPAPADVPARVADAGLDLGPMGMAEHYHPQLRIVIGGKEVPIPADIGVDPATGAMSAVHTHETDGTIHIEADTTGETFTLGQLFTQWGVKLTPTQIGGVTAKDGQQMNVTSNGAPVAGDPMDLRLEPDQKIVLRLP
ncbi:MAG TPA: hypothetical protein VFD59_02615 [Nocardioidaceae bacterium]|nr:hypothetical protein [Nocardioidaceae bacterium]